MFDVVSKALQHNVQFPNSSSTYRVIPEGRVLHLNTESAYEDGGKHDGIASEEGAVVGCELVGPGDAGDGMGVLEDT